MEVILLAIFAVLAFVFIMAGGALFNGALVYAAVNWVIPAAGFHMAHWGAMRSMAVGLLMTLVFGLVKGLFS